MVLRRRPALQAGRASNGAETQNVVNLPVLHFSADSTRIRRFAASAQRSLAHVV